MIMILGVIVGLAAQVVMLCVFGPEVWAGFLLGQLFMFGCFMIEEVLL